MLYDSDSRYVELNVQNFKRNGKPKDNKILSSRLHPRPDFINESLPWFPLFLFPLGVPSPHAQETGAVTGNILGALLGYGAIADQWKKDLELSDVILEVADDLCHGCQMSEYSHYKDPDWASKYMYMRRPVRKTRSIEC